MLSPERLESLKTLEEMLAAESREIGAELRARYSQVENGDREKLRAWLMAARRAISRAIRTGVDPKSTGWPKG